MVPEKIFAKYLKNLKRGYSKAKIRTEKMPPIAIEDADKMFGWAHKLATVQELITGGESEAQALEAVEALPFLTTKFPIECSICLDSEVKATDGVVLKQCFHMFCR